MTSSKRDTQGLVFDISALNSNEKLKIVTLHRAYANFIMLGYNPYIEEVVDNYVDSKPTFEEPNRVMYLNHEDYYQYLMIKHLPWVDILEYFRAKYERNLPFV